MGSRHPNAYMPVHSPTRERSILKNAFGFKPRLSSSVSSVLPGIPLERLTAGRPFAMRQPTMA